MCERHSSSENDGQLVGEKRGSALRLTPANPGSGLKPTQKPRSKTRQPRPLSQPQLLAPPPVHSQKANGAGLSLLHMFLLTNQLSSSNLQICRAKRMFKSTKLRFPPQYAVNPNRQITFHPLLMVQAYLSKGVHQSPLTLGVQCFPAPTSLPCHFPM